MERNSRNVDVQWFVQGFYCLFFYIEYVNVAKIALKNRAAVITGKIRAIKEKRDDKATIAQFEEIINELLTNKNALIRIIGTYEKEFVAQKLTDSDMEYIIKNVLPALIEIAESMEQEQA
ncbi:hypothetical protein GIX45_10760 [Erwinia sp. CPCC 100877]|nr:hypothetical protein [Erwinia sp. CPCC 100877]